MLIFDETGRSWGLGRKIASGGEGTVHALLDSPDYCAKLYHALPLPPLKQAKLAALRSFPAATRQNAAIPVSLAFAQPGDPSPHAVILPLVSGHDIYELYNPQGRSRHFSGATFEFLVAAAKNLAAAFHNLHAHGIIVGDVNEQNIKVRADATVRFIDCDSFQFSHGGRLYTSDVGTPLWTPPELQGTSVQGLERSINHDAFGLAQLVFLLLFAGRYPYAGRPLTNAQLSPEDAIRQYAFAYAPASRNRQGGSAALSPDAPGNPLLAPPPGAPAFGALPVELRALFVRAFSEGSAVPGSRPDADEWMNALQLLADNLDACPVSRQHIFWKGAAACPWCAVRRMVNVDLFPATPARVTAASGVSPEHLALAARLLDITFHPLALVEPAPSAVASHPSPRPVHRGRRSLYAAVQRLFGLASTQPSDADALRQELRDLDQRLLEIRNSADTLTRLHRTACKPVLEKAATIAAKLKDPTAFRVDALEQLGDEYRSLAMEKHLEGFLLRRTKIPGIGGIRMAALLSAGITTAADVREEHIGTVPWIGPSCAAKLLAWRQECEAQFKFNASGVLPESLRARWNALLNRKLGELAREGGLAEQSAREAVAAYAREFGRLQQAFESVWKQRASVQADLDALG